MIELLVVVLCALIIAAMGFMGFLFREERKLLRQIRKTAALYPPYPTTVGEADMSSVKLDNEWNDGGAGRD